LARVINRVQVAADEAETGYVTTSGIYPLHLKGIELKETTNGAVQANYYFDKVMSYGNMLLAKDGKELFGFRAIDSLAIIEDLESYANSPEELEELTMKFKSGDKTVMVIPELSDIEVLAHIQFEYSVYNDEIQERVSVKRFYRPSDSATSTEIVNETEPGLKHANDVEKYADTVVYKDNLDAVQVKAWKDAKKSGTATAAPKGGAAKAAGFGTAKKGFGAPSQAQ